MEIRDRELYKIKNGGSYQTFEQYCRGEWDFTKSYANYLISSTSVIDNISTVATIVVKPATESQARPLARLEPQQQREAWQKAVETAPEGKVTAAHVQKIVRGMQEVVDDVTDRLQIFPINLEQTRPLARLMPDKQREAWQKAVSTAPEGKEKIPLTFLERSFYIAILEGAIFPGARRGTSERTHPERISVFFYARGIGPSPFPCAGCNRGQVPGDHPSDIESTLERAA
jgi:hypothetical protein